MHRCTWCGAASRIIHTRRHEDSPPDQRPILLCLDRDACLKRLREQTDQQLTGARP